jgi:hypothetical protein
MKAGNGIRQDIEIRRGSQLIYPHAVSVAMFLSHGNNTRSWLNLHASRVVPA